MPHVGVGRAGLMSNLRRRGGGISARQDLGGPAPGLVASVEHGDPFMFEPAQQPPQSAPVHPARIVVGNHLGSRRSPRPESAEKLQVGRWRPLRPFGGEERSSSRW